MEKTKVLLMAAGKGSRISEISIETPKPLIKINGKPMIEITIEKLLELNVDEIIITVGYKKELYYYLKEKYQKIKLVENKDYLNTNTVSSFYYAINDIENYNTLILESDLYYKDPEVLDNDFSHSHYYIKMTEPQDEEWGFVLENDKILKIVRPKASVFLNHHMYGIAYWKKEDLNLLIQVIKKAYGKEGFEYFAYDEFANQIFQKIHMNVKKVEPDKIYEIDTLDNLLEVDQSYLKFKQEKHILSEDHIETFLKVMNLDLRDIKRIYTNPGRSANNSNYVIDVENESYLYRVAGEGTELFVDRQKEKRAYQILDDFSITDKMIFLDENSGVKISKYYNNSRIPNSNNELELKKCMDLLKKVHLFEIDFDYEESLIQRAEKYYKFAIEAGGEEFYLPRFQSFYKKLIEFNQIITKFNIKKIFTHGDASINNFLVLPESNGVIMIDLEFPAKSDPFDDLATFAVDADYRENDIIKILELYLERESSDFEKYHVLGLSATAALMWYSWATYKSAVENENTMYLNFRDDYHYYLEDLLNTLEKYEHLLEI